MPQNRSTMMEPNIESLLDQVDSKFTLVTLSSRRGRQINAYFNQLGEGLGAIVPPQVTSTARKPLSIALEEIAAGKITYVRVDPDQEGADAESGEGEGAELVAVSADEAVSSDSLTSESTGMSDAPEAS